MNIHTHTVTHTYIFIPISQFSRTSRVTQGVRLISLKDNQKVTSVFNIPKEETEETENVVVEENQNKEAE